MNQKRYSEEQIVYALGQAEGGTKVVEVCAKLGVSEATFYAWRKKYAGLGCRSCGNCGSCGRRTGG